MAEPVLEKGHLENIIWPKFRLFYTVILPGTAVFLLCLVSVQPITDITSYVTKPSPTNTPGKRLSFESILVGSYGPPHPSSLVDVRG